MACLSSPAYPVNGVGNQLVAEEGQRRAEVTAVDMNMRAIEEQLQVCGRCVGWGGVWGDGMFGSGVCCVGSWAERHLIRPSHLVWLVGLAPPVLWLSYHSSWLG
eukprot:359935-Chlamydomonas_euryale.AAC.2